MDRHPDINLALARQRIDEAQHLATLRRRRRGAHRPAPVRLRLGRRLVRWGTRLGATAPTGAPARALAAATMTA